MKQSVEIYGRFIKRYEIPLDLIDDLNDRYEKKKKSLETAGRFLVGRIQTELKILPFLQSTKIWPTFDWCIKDYLVHANHFGLSEDATPNVALTNCWINDMVSGEYNPPHTHYDGIGFSVVLFLKIPEIINDIEGDHKFRDGQIGFFDDTSTRWKIPKVGDFYIFEAVHQHCVMPFKTKKPGDIRRSMSFNFCIEKDVRK